MKKRIFLTLAALLTLLTGASAQQYVVYGVSGKVEVTTAHGKHMVKLRENLYPETTVNMPYGATLELIDTESRKQYTLRTPGKAKLESMLADRRNSVLKLTSKYFDYVIAQLKGSSQVVSKRVSDPATVTREIAFDSMYVREIAAKDSLKTKSAAAADSLSVTNPNE